MAPMDHHHHSVKILELSTVSPLSSDDHQSFSSPKSLPLTFFDILWLRFPPTQRLFFYDFPLNESSFFNTLLPKLKHSLSLILRHYLPLAGNLFWPQNSKPIILFSEGDGVLLTVAESESDHFDYLSGDGFREVVGYHSLVSELPVSNEGIAVISLQITLFPNRGFSIGITSHHAILDGRSSTSFIKSWAQICSSLNDVTGTGLSKTELTPFYDRTVVDDPKGLEEIYMKAWQSVDGPNNKSLKLLSFKTPPGLIRCTVELTRENIEKLKKWVLKNHDDDDERNQKRPFHVSSFTLTCAYLWVCAVKSKNLKTEEEIEFIFSVDARSRIEPPLPMNYFGNCILGRHCCIKRNDLLGEKGLIFATKAISEQIKSLEEGSVMEGAERYGSMVQNAGEKELGETFFSIAGSPRFEVYKNTDFGWGKPRKVEVVSVDRTGAFSLAESRNGNGGIEIGFVGKRDEIQRFAALFVEDLQSL